ncbi:MAG: transcriptional regulator [bacterium]|jgi:thiaminase/transcriptional activator TenA
MSTSPHLYQHLKDVANPWIDKKYRHAALVQLFDGSLDSRIMRYWLEQDYQYLLEYARSFSRIASHAPNEHLLTLVDGAHYTLNIELPRLKQLGELFSASYTNTLMGNSCIDYTTYLKLYSSNFATGIISMVPCMMGFATLGISISPPDEPRYRQWVETYSSADFQGYTDRYAKIVDALDISYESAESIFVEGMQHELKFWDEAYLSINS